VGRCLARRLNWQFIDCDQVLVDQAGMTVADIVAKWGWDHFRKLEKETLREICTKTYQVVATGGGVVLDAQNVRLLSGSGYVVWLRAAAETVYKRIQQDQQTSEMRPPLTDLTLLEEIQETLDQRRPLYEQAMNTGIDTDRKQVDAICREITSGLR